MRKYHNYLINSKFDKMNFIQFMKSDYEIALVKSENLGTLKYEFSLFVDKLIAIDVEYKAVYNEHRIDAFGKVFKFWQNPSRIIYQDCRKAVIVELWGSNLQPSIDTLNRI
jgi:hypothetical protein